MKVTTQLVVAARQELIELISECEVESKVSGLTDVALSAEQAQTILSILEWAAERLETQRSNSKIYLEKQKLVNKMIKQHLSQDELAEIDRQARAKAGA